MFQWKFVLLCFIMASVEADKKNDGFKPTTQKTPELKTRFFNLDNVLGQIFDGLIPGPGNSGGTFHHSPQYHNQQNPQFNNWQNMQSPNQAQLNLDQQLHLQSTTLYPQGNFNPQNTFGPGFNLNNQQPQQFPNQQNFNQPYPSTSNPQGNFNSGNNFGQNQNINTGTLDGIPTQNGINQGHRPTGNRNQSENQFENQNAGNQFQNQNGNQPGFQNQNTQAVDDYNPVAILGKPVAMTTSAPDSIVFPDGCDTPTQRQCVQDCQSRTEYEPVCGSNNVTYYNPGRFICARNCGINVFIQRNGRCDK